GIERPSTISSILCNHFEGAHDLFEKERRTIEAADTDNKQEVSKAQEDRVAPDLVGRDIDIERVNIEQAMAEEDAFLVDNVEGALCVDYTDARIGGRCNSRSDMNKGKVGE
ncbi:hypothetical protein Tco_1481232, partial [Tanacetum coccineum]